MNKKWLAVMAIIGMTVACSNGETSSEDTMDNAQSEMMDDAEMDSGEMNDEAEMNDNSGDDEATEAEATEEGDGTAELSAGEPVKVQEVKEVEGGGRSRNNAPATETENTQAGSMMNESDTKK